MDLADLKAELFRRLEYSDPNKELEYQKKRKQVNDKYPDEGWRIPQSYIKEMENLKNNKLREIREQLNDDDGFKLLVDQLPIVEFNKDKKEQELKMLVPPNKPNFSQRLYTNVFGKTNTADVEINNFNAKTKSIQDEIADLQKIISDIGTLKPVYDKVLTDVSEYDKTTFGGAKNKTRRNRNSNQSRRKLRKSNCRY